MLLHEFLTLNQAELVDRCRRKVAQRSPGAPQRDLQHGIAPFLDQLIRTLQVEEVGDRTESRKVSGAADGQPALSEIGGTASDHGRELLHHGYTVEEVVHDYGDLCQSITDLAFETHIPFSTDEFRTLNRCLDNAMATAVTEFAYQRDFKVADQQAKDLNQHLGFFAHELRNLVTTATLAVNIMKTGNVGITGATGAVLDRSLMGMRKLIDSSLAEVRMSASAIMEPQVFSLGGFIEELKVTASMEADVKGCHLIVAEVGSDLAVKGDRDLLLAAAGNLLQNAFKFTRPGSEVTLNAYASGGRVLIDVEDSCGGLKPSDIENMFAPYVQLGADKTGVGLGLSIARRSVEANHGTLSVRSVEHEGCIFTIDLPRYLDTSPAAPPAQSVPA